MNLADNPLASPADPGTSHAAADRVRKSGVRRAHAARVFALVRRFPGSTYRELAVHLRPAEFDATELMRRLNDLFEAGLVRKCETRRCTVGKKQMTTWRPTTEGAKGMQGTLF